MPVPLPQVKQLCAAGEYALVKSSRKPELQRITLRQAKANAARARKLFDKWHGQSRSQARARSRQVGLAETGTRSEQKARIFQEALQSFESHAAALEGAAAAETAPRRKGKKVRTLQHREQRAAVRAELDDKRQKLQARSKRKRPTVSRPVAASAPESSAELQDDPSATDTPGSPVTAGQSPSKGIPATRPAARVGRRPLPSAAMAQARLAAGKGEQRATSTAAKQTRLARSGVTTRVRGHVSAAGRRAQGRRDKKS